MIDQTPDGAPQDVDAGPRLEIRHQYIRDLSFEVPGAPEVFETIAAAPEVAVNVGVNTRSLGDRGHEVSLRVEARGHSAGSPMFIAELEYAGLVRLQNIPEDHLEPTLHIEVARLLFPFARNVIAGLTRDGGLPQLMINPIDFVALYQRSKGQQRPGHPSVDNEGES